MDMMSYIPMAKVSVAAYKVQAQEYFGKALKIPIHFYK